MKMHGLSRHHIRRRAGLRRGCSVSPRSQLSACLRPYCVGGPTHALTFVVSRKRDRKRGGGDFVVAFFWDHCSLCVAPLCLGGYTAVNAHSRELYKGLKKGGPWIVSTHLRPCRTYVCFLDRYSPPFVQVNLILCTRSVYRSSSHSILILKLI